MTLVELREESSPDPVWGSRTSDRPATPSESSHVPHGFGTSRDASEEEAKGWARGVSVTSDSIPRGMGILVGRGTSGGIEYTAIR